MSEYQYYEFRKIKKPLTADEQAALRNSSSRVQVDSHSAVFEYSYSDFRGSPEDLLAKHFDMMLQYANFGDKRILFRFDPLEVKEDAMKAYEWSEDIFDGEHSLSVYEKDGYIILDIIENREGGYRTWFEGDGVLTQMLPVWKEIQSGDYAALHLAFSYFLKTLMDFEDEDDEEKESTDLMKRWKALPVPAGVKSPSPALKAFKAFLEME